MRASYIWNVTVLKFFQKFFQQFWQSLIDINIRKLTCLRFYIWILKKESHAKENFESNLSNNDFTSLEEQINNLRLKNPNKLICAHFDISSPRNKFDLLPNIIKDKVDMPMISKPSYICLFLKDSFIYMASLNYIDLTEIEMVVEYLCLFVTTYTPNL